jgi:hypothetical protein
MAKYKQYENLPWWLNNLNDNTLTPTQKAVLDLDYYCKKHGTKLSHQRAADELHRSRQRVYESRRRLEDLRLRTTSPAKGSYLVGHPVEYQDEAEWLADLQARGVDPRRSKNKRKSLQKKRPLQGLSSSEVQNEAGSKQPAGEVFSQAPRGLTDRCSGGTKAESPEQQKARDEFAWQVTYRDSLSKLLNVPWPREKAERLARIKADNCLVQRNSDPKKH